MDFLDNMKKTVVRTRDYADLIPGVIAERLNIFRRSKYILEHVAGVIAELEESANIDSRESAIRGLRQLGLDDFGYVLWSMPNPNFPKLSALLPKMASPQVQRAWTGRSGMGLLRQTADFVRAVSGNYSDQTGFSLRGSQVLDFGSGYGRVARLMYYFVDEANVTGVDPMERSISQCQSAGLADRFFLSDYLPSMLPVGNERFQLIYAFSVFTHLSERALRVALSTLRKYIHNEGVLAITIRPIEYWQFAAHVDAQSASRLEQVHRSVGIAFRPHERERVDGEITYGDTSISLHWLRSNCPGWRVVAQDRSLSDRLQTYVFLRPIA